jgi:hypothetical protein
MDAYVITPTILAPLCLKKKGLCEVLFFTLRFSIPGTGSNHQFPVCLDGGPAGRKQMRMGAGASAPPDPLSLQARREKRKQYNSHARHTCESRYPACAKTLSHRLKSA